MKLEGLESLIHKAVVENTPAILKNEEITPEYLKSLDEYPFGDIEIVKLLEAYLASLDPKDFNQLVEYVNGTPSLPVAVPATHKKRGRHPIKHALYSLYDRKIKDEEFSQLLSDEIQSLRSEPVSLAEFSEELDEISEKFSKTISDKISKLVFSPDDANSKLEIIQEVKAQDTYPYKTNVNMDFLLGVLNSVKKEEMVKNIPSIMNYFSNKSIQDLITIEKTIFSKINSVDFSEIIKAINKDPNSVVKSIDPLLNPRPISSEDLLPGKVFRKEDGTCFKVLANELDSSSSRKLSIKVFANVQDYVFDKGKETSISCRNDFSIDSYQVICDKSDFCFKDIRELDSGTEFAFAPGNEFVPEGNYKVIRKEDENSIILQPDYSVSLRSLFSKTGRKFPY